MFKKRERLTRSEFQEYFRTGTRHHSKHVTLITATSSKRKVAVVVGKKVAKSAVKRNLYKRRIFGVLQTIPCTGVLIVIVKPTFATLSRKTAAVVLTTEVARVCKSA
ncbi:ribonuclease P protein component [Candidatus Kaiserbacteria bacterium]|nr:ribonuclease P protein component [Candidatus Kaiserbacteria bacterium]USN89137.1 MAG: ribonuclease P protein component [Candidatus Nomurabacteria bacterium]